MERQVHRFVSQNNPVVCKEESASFIKELLKLHIADLRPMPRRLRAPSIDHVNGQAAGLAFLPGVTQGESLVFDAFPVFVAGRMKDVSKGSATVQREGLSKSRRVSNVGHSGVTLHGRQADVPIDGRRIIVVQTAKLHMDREPRLGIPKKESQDFEVPSGRPAGRGRCSQREHRCTCQGWCPCYDGAGRSGACSF